MMDIDITMADPQTKVSNFFGCFRINSNLQALYLAKREDWTILENDLDNMPRGDYSMQDQVQKPIWAYLSEKNFSMDSLLYC